MSYYSLKRPRGNTVILYRGEVYREALPYKTSPAIPERLWRDAVMADKFLRDLAKEDLETLLEAADKRAPLEKRATLICYQGAVYREALDTSVVSQEEKRKIIETLASQYAHFSLTSRRAPWMGRDISDYAAAEAAQLLHDDYASSPDENKQLLAQYIAQINLRKITRESDMYNLIWHAISSEAHDVTIDEREQAISVRNIIHNVLKPNMRDIDRKYQDYKKQVYLQEGRRLAERMIRRVEAMLQKVDGKNCYRMMELKSDMDPKELKSIGYYWSLDPRKVGVYQGPGFADPAFWRFRARVDAEAVDIRETIEANMDYEFGSAEKEIMMKEGSQIWVYDAQRIYAYEGLKQERAGLEYGTYKLGKKVKINRWMPVDPTDQLGELLDY